MVTDLDNISALQALADSTGLIIDRAQYPEKVVGQCWLISKGRVVTLASSVSNYTDAPWALQIKFPHPDLNYGVRTVTLHPDFNKREARDYYLAQARGPVPQPMLDNDIATLALDSDLSPPPPERVGELNRALSVPFALTGQDMSGTMRQGEVPAILQSVLGTGRSGILSMIDSRNVPFARIAVRQTRITRVSFQNLFNELAFSELLLRQPPGSFAFQPIEYAFPADVPEIALPTEQMMAEAQRRFDELPRMMEMLGGFESRFTKATAMVDFSTIPASERWLAERVWEALDGFMTLNFVAERVGSDTYSAVKMIWDLATMGLLSVNQNQVFHGSGQLGPLLVPAQDLELNTWDSLTAFYLDPISASPIAMTGNFFGGAHVLSNKTLLHTTPIPPSSMGAIILKDGKLVGLHTGIHTLVAVPNPPPIVLQRMMWIGSLNDLGTKRVRTAELAAAEAAEGGEGSGDQAAAPKQSARLRAVSEPAHDPGKASPVPEETGPLAKFSKQQILVAAGVIALIGLVMVISSFAAPHGPAVPPPNTVAQSPADKPSPSSTTAVAQQPKPVPLSPEDETKLEERIGDPAAAKVAADMMGLKDPPSSYKFKDTSTLTDPKPSFALVSEGKNVELTFIQWPNQSVTLDPDLIARRTVIYNYVRNDDNHNEFQGQQGPVNWVGGHYAAPDGGPAHVTLAVGTWEDPTHPGKYITFIAKPVSGDSMSDMEYPAHFIDQLINTQVATAKQAGNAGQSPAVTGVLATPEELADYRKKLAALIKAEYKPPHYDLDTDTKVGLKVTVDAKGNIKDLSLQPNPNEDFNNALQKAVTAVKPCPAPPRTKTGTYALLIRAHANDIMIEEQ
jgi:hypothetical protein